MEIMERFKRFFHHGVNKRIKTELEKTNNMGNTCLSLAVKNNYHYIAKYLIDHGADINHVNNAKQPILFIPCWSNDQQMVSLLFEAGADVNYQDSRGWTPLMIAAAQGFEDLIEFLLQHNANVDLKDKYGKKAADKAKSQSIFYMISSAAIDRRMKVSKDQIANFSPQKLMMEEDLEREYRTQPANHPSEDTTAKV